MSIQLNVEETGPAPVIKVEGEIDLYSSPKLREEIKQQLKKKTKLLIIDLSKVDYMDSSGVATLVEGLKKLHQINGQLKLIGLTDPVMQVFKFAHLDKVFTIHRTVEEALA